MTPIQRLVKTTELDSMKDRDYVGDAKYGSLAGTAGYLMARKKGRWPAKVSAVLAASTVIGIKHNWHNRLVDRAIPHYDQTT